MTKADIVNEISRSTGIEKSAVLATVEKFMDVVKESMAGGPQHLPQHGHQDPGSQGADFQTLESIS